MIKKMRASYNIQMTNNKVVLVLATILLAIHSLPYRERIALANSLQVGRIQDPNIWSCAGCDDDNKPLHSYVIEEPTAEIRSILSVYQEYTVLAFRYTANAKNLWQDVLWAIQTQDQGAPEGCKVQRQYDNMWNLIREDVLKGLRENSHTKRLVITGISLGGGLACISFVDIQKSQIFDNVEVVTYGAPRVGNAKWAAWFDSITTSTRIYIKDDPIAFLPRCLTLICNYRQTGRPYVCDKANEICQYKGSEENLKFNFSAEAMKMITAELIEHQNELKDGQLGGIVDHIYNYKTLYPYSMKA